MGTPIANPEVRFTTNSGEYVADMNRIKAASQSTTASFASMGGAFGHHGEILETGLRKSTMELSHLAAAFGSTSGEATRFAGALTSIAFTGLNPIALGVVAAGVAITGIVEHFAEAKKAAGEFAKETTAAARELRQMQAEIDDLNAGTKTAGLVRYKEALEDAEAALHKLERAAIDEQARGGAVLFGVDLEELHEAQQRVETARERLSRAQKRLDAEDAASARMKSQAQVEASAAAVNQFVLEANQIKMLARYNDELTKLVLKSRFAYDARRAAIKGITEEQHHQLEDAQFAIEQDIKANYLRAQAAKAAEVEEKRLSQAIKDHEEERKRVLAGFLADAKAEKDQHDLITTALKKQEEEEKKLAAERLKDHLAAIEAFQKEVEALEEVRIAQRETFERTDFGAGYAAEMRKLTAESNELGVVGGRVADELTHGFSSGLASALVDVADGSKTAQQAFSDFAKSVVDDLARMVLEATIFRAVMGALGYVSGPTADPNANGGGYYSGVNGSRGPSEGVYTKSALAGGGGGTRITINNNAGADVGAASQTGSDGIEEVMIHIEKRMASNVRRGGALAQAIEETHGVKRVPRRR